MADKICTWDWETEAITGPGLPPKPVGLAVQFPGKAAQYLAFGHPTGNNCSRDDVAKVLHKIWTGGYTLLGHNQAFDISVAMKHFGMPFPSKVLDTLFLLFLVDPHADTLSLKPAAEKHLGMPPEEQDAVRDWLVEQGVVRKGQKGWGAHIAQAPGDLVGRYAIGDVKRTLALHEKLYPTLDARMREAYDREVRLLPILMENERVGMRLDVARLTTDIRVYERALVTADAAVRRRLRSESLNVDSPVEVAEALKRAGVVKAFKKTPTGKDSTAKKNMTEDMFTDVEVYRLLGYRGRLETVLANSMRPWLASVDAKGMIHTSWNQVRSTDTGGAKGTRTGRLSCSRFMNISKSWEGFVPPRGKLPSLPLVRRYILPDEGQSIWHRDYSQQELRVLAHMEDGVMLDAYQSAPRLDFHTKTQELVRLATGLEISRHTTKTVVFGLIYGMGAGLLAEKLGVSVEEAVSLRGAVKATLPGVALLDRSLKELGKAGKPIRTWGGRQYLPETPRLVNGSMRSFEYKLLNVIVQGSSADCTKEALIRYHQHPRREGRLLVTVHDEVNVSGMEGESEVLREAMEGIEFDVPMLTEAKSGPNWGELR